VWGGKQQFHFGLRFSLTAISIAFMIGKLSLKHYVTGGSLLFSKPITRVVPFRRRVALLGFSCALFAAAGTAQAPMTANEIVLHNFVPPPNGANPQAGVIRDSAGNLYGTTEYGGASNAGVVYKVDATGRETVLHAFTGGADGSYPYAGVIRDPDGNLYGTTTGGGTAHAGVVFKVDATGHQTVLYNFTGGADGLFPYAGVVRDSAGNLYGTTTRGGTAHAGVVYKVDVAGDETVLYSFTGGFDGGYPYAGLIRDAAGNLYGTASNYLSVLFPGVVYKVDTAGHETVLHSFGGGLSDGYRPYAGVIRDSAGNLYGTTPEGGTAGAGVVYKVDPTGHETVLYSFTGGADGGQP
jgi:uncharacterized repeat protein (TIGR03803 family)